MLEKHQLTGPNFNEWFRALKLVVHTEKLQDVFETALPPTPAAGAGAQALADWAVLFYCHTEVACLMLETMSPKLYQRFEHNSPLEMVTELQKKCMENLQKSTQRNKQPIIGASSTPQVMAIQGGRVQKYKPQGKAKGKGKGKGPQNSYPTKPKKPQPYKKERPAKDGQCHHCKEERHWKRNCLVYLAELMKKKKKTGGQNVASTSSGIYTIELFAFPKNSWVYDTGCGTHICNTKQRLRGAKKMKRGSLYLYVGNGVRAKVEAIGSFNLVLPNGLIIVLDNCHYAPSITRGVVSVSRLVDKKHIEKLQHDGLLKSTDNEPFDQCVSCISGKMTRKPFSHKSEKLKDVLGLIHTDVCGPLRYVSKKGASYFITFTDDYSRYSYVYLLNHKHEVFETFKVFKSEVENQLGKTIKAIRSDRGGEYISQEFKDYLKACGIV
uniref:Retrotransposon protein, putative, Ty1-copia subclass n=1 Tax=Tanacetum cinerariifolium TaxID=118510 RepID=A0A699KR25_TANCI|nr:retrotransposon protein, putative, Ty1-copia subclass [Tanacetum cinerariifolium]